MTANQFHKWWLTKSTQIVKKKELEDQKVEWGKG